MWIRSELKKNAKKVLKTSYWSALLVSLISLLLNGGSNWFSRRYDQSDFQNFNGTQVDWGSFLNNFWIQLLFMSIGLAVLVAIFFKIFISTTIQVGEHRWFSRNRESSAKPSIGQMFSLFRGDSWLPTVGAMLWMMLWLWIWSLLPLIPILAAITGIVLYLVLVSPIILPAGFNWADWMRAMNAGDGRFDRRSFNWQSDSDAYRFFQEQAPQFWADNQNTFLLILAIVLAAIILSLALSIPYTIKSYAYRMTPWILADNPRIGYRRALRLSRQMMRGNKFDLFVLDLSFIGWYLLGLLAFVIGTWFVRPYQQATVAELYAVLRKNTVSQGLATMEDFGFRAVNQPTVEPQPITDPAFNTDTENETAPISENNTTPEE